MFTLSPKRFALSILSLILALGLAAAQEEGGADDDVAPAPPSIGADIPLTYFGPAPSEVQREHRSGLESGFDASLHLARSRRPL